jgi:hypothetical protein
MAVQKARGMTGAVLQNAKRFPGMSTARGTRVRARARAAIYQRSFWSASLAAFLTDSGYCR